MYFFKLNLNNTDASLRRTDSVGLEGVKRKMTLERKTAKVLAKYACYDKVHHKTSAFHYKYRGSTEYIQVVGQNEIQVKMV